MLYRHSLSLTLTTLAIAFFAARDADAEEKIRFKTQIEPLFERSCNSCHGIKRQKGDLRLDKEKHAMAGGESGKVILPGNGAGSLLVKLVRLPDDDRRVMPARGERLSDDEIALIEKWIDQGAEWGR